MKKIYNKNIGREKMKNKIMIIIILFVLVILPVSVNASGFCTSKKYSNLKSKSYKTNFSYELKFDENHNYYFEARATNVSEDILIKFNGITYEPKQDNDTINIESRLEGGMTYEFNLYAGYDTDCNEEFLYTKKLRIPKYNVYSEKDECIEYEEFELCNKWYQGVINSDDDFNEQLQRYIDSLKKEEPEIEVKEEKSLFQKIIDFYVENIMITLPITILIVVMIIYKVIVTIVRKRRRIKLDS